MKMPFLLISPKIVPKIRLIKKDGFFEYYAVIADKIEYCYVHRTSICPALGMDCPGINGQHKKSTCNGLCEVALRERRHSSFSPDVLVVIEMDAAIHPCSCFGKGSGKESSNALCFEGGEEFFAPALSQQHSFPSDSKGGWFAVSCLFFPDLRRVMISGSTALIRVSFLFGINLPPDVVLLCFYIRGSVLSIARFTGAVQYGARFLLC